MEAGTARIDVRPARTADVSTLVGMMADFYAEADYSLPEEAATRAFHALLADERLGRIWLIESDGEAAGYVVLTLGFSMEYGGLRGFVDDLFVCERFRGRGLAAAALAEVRHTCIEIGVRALLVEVGAGDDAALRLYRRCEFEESGRVLMTATLATPVHQE